MIYSFFVPGRPVGKERPRKGKYGNFYTPKKTQFFESWVRLHCVAACGHNHKLDSTHAWELHVTIYGTTRVDVDNVIKSVMDSLQGCIYANDRQVRRVGGEYDPLTLFNGKNGVLVECEQLGRMDVAADAATYAADAATYAAARAAIHKQMADMIRREITWQDIEKLLKRRLK